MKPLVVILFLIVSLLLVLCYSDKIATVFEGVTSYRGDSYHEDSYIVIGTPKNILSLQKSNKGEIKYAIFVRGKADDFLPANFIGVGEE